MILKKSRIHVFICMCSNSLDVSGAGISLLSSSTFTHSSANYTLTKKSAPMNKKKACLSNPCIFPLKVESIKDGSGSYF